jgi:hypothetical protein
VDEREPRPLRRSKLRYPSDLTDDEWRPVEPLIVRSRIMIHCIMIRCIVTASGYDFAGGSCHKGFPMTAPAASAARAGVMVFA